MEMAFSQLIVCSIAYALCTVQYTCDEVVSLMTSKRSPFSNPARALRVWGRGMVRMLPAVRYTLAPKQ